MNSGKYIPESGDLVWLDFTPQTGYEQKGKRPAVILSPKSYNKKTHLCIAVPVTSKIKNYPFEIPLPKDIKIKGVVLADHIKSLDYTKREISFITKLPYETVEKIKKYSIALIS